MKKSRVLSSDAEISHFLGVDFGAAKVGLAMADAETKIAFVYDTIKNDKNLVQNIGQICEKENVKTIVLGTSFEKGMKQRDFDVQKIADTLRKSLGVEVVFQEEMFTTKMAEDNLIAKGVKGLKKFDDAEAAKIILQSWIDKHNN
jgi:putative transcription antitermination factor YqgF